MRTLFILLLFLGVANYSCAWYVPSPQDTTKGMVFDTPEIMPQFPGGPHAIDEYIRNNVKYPASAVKEKLHGKVYVEFVVEKDGTVSNIKIRMGRHEVLNKEAIRLIKSMPKWKPGSNRGKVVRTRYTLPIQFALKNSK